MKQCILLFAIILCLSIGVVGCQLFELKEGVDGKPTTAFENHMQAVANIGRVSSPFLPQPIGVAVGGIAAILGLIGTAATAIVVARRRGATLEAVVRGVEEAGNPEVKKYIRNAAIRMGYQPYLEKAVRSFTPPPDPLVVKS